MKTTLLALCPALLLVSCAAPGVRVTHTDVATGATHPKAIYIRPFRVACFDECTPSGNAPIRRSLLPVEFANDLQEELSKIAPARVLEPYEDAPLGWIVDGEFRAVESGYSPERWRPLGDAVSRKSCVLLHVRVSQAGCRSRPVLYEFDVAAATKEGAFGSITSPGLGYPLPFDRRNAAELIAKELTPDPFRYGVRSSPEFRY